MIFLLIKESTLDKWMPDMGVAFFEFSMAATCGRNHSSPIQKDKARIARALSFV